MPETLPDHIPSPRTPLVWDGTRYRAVRGYTDGTVQVRGEDQLFSIAGVIPLHKTGAISGAGGFYESVPVPAGAYWNVTAVAAIDRTTPTTAHYYYVNHGGTLVLFHHIAAAIGANIPTSWGGHVFLDAEDTIRCYFVGGLAGDTCDVHINGYQMTIET